MQQVPLVHFQKKIQISTQVFFGLLLYALLSINVQSVQAAEVQMVPSTGTYSAGQSFTVTVSVDPEGDSVNAVEAQLSFDTSVLSVVEVSKTGSIFSLWTTEPTFSNSAGTIEFGGGSPTPFSSQSTLAVVTFRALAEGTGAVDVISASALAADGLGTDVYSSAVNASYTISGDAPPPETPETVTPTETAPEDNSSDAAITFGDPPRIPEIGSAVFLDPELWYSNTEGLFTWELPFDVDAAAIDIATSSEYEPETIYDPPIEEFMITGDLVSDGVQYLTVQFRNQVGWGVILHRELKIDTTPPEDFTINVRAGNAVDAFPLLTFKAEDETSGVDYYEMTIAGGEPIEVTPDEANLGYLLQKLEDGTYTVKVVAYDKAGNTTEASTPVLITAGWTPPVEIEEVTSVWDLFRGKNLIILILILVIIGLGTQIVYSRKKNNKKEQKLRKETREVQDQMEKIFSALRDEIYDQINSITKRQRLSKREREAVEELNQALEVSETMIEKEIGDVKKILK